MNEIERQILKNQRTIMSVLRRYSSDKEHNINVSEICTRQIETLNLLEPVEKPIKKFEHIEVWNDGIIREDMLDNILNCYNMIAEKTE